MARPRRISDEQILSATRRAVLEHGPRVALHEIATRLGVSEPALLKRFGNRERLLLSALRPPDEWPWVARIALLPGDGPLLGQLEELLHAMADFFDQAVPCLAALRESGLPQDQIFGQTRPGPRRAVEALTGWLQRARQAGLIGPVEEESVALALLGAVQAHAFLSHLLRGSPISGSRADYLRALATLFVTALAPRPARARARARHAAHGPKPLTRAPHRSPRLRGPRR